MSQSAQALDASATKPPAGFATVKARMKATWEDGDYAAFAKFMEPGAVEILDAWNIAAGQRLLDIGCGSGQSAIPAARRGLRVTGVDIAENLIDYARNRAETEGLAARFDVGDAEDLPYEDASYDAAISMIGAMFAPRPDAVVAEMARVIRPGGKLYMANWTPRSMPAQMFKCVASVVPPPPDFVPPVLWGDETTMRTRLGEDFTGITLIRRFYPQWHYNFGAADLVELFRNHFGPVKRAFEAVYETARAELHQHLEQIFAVNSKTENGVLTITNGEYLEVIATRR